MNKERLRKLIVELCKVKSVTETEMEVEMAHWILAHLQTWQYFKEHPKRVFLQNVEGDFFNRKNVVAQVHARKKTNKTIVFINHFDVVDTNVCGRLKDEAFDLEQYTKQIGREKLSDDIHTDLESGEWLFGRGSMDMKGGLAVQLEVIRSFTENLNELPVNLLWLGLCDEENNGLGSIQAAKYIRSLEEEGENILAIINSEPSITTSNEKKALIHTGTIGKYLPFVYVLGKEAHVGEYEEGLNGSVLLGELLKRLEGNLELREGMNGHYFSPSTCLRIRELKEYYSVTLIEKVVAYFNVLTVKRRPQEILDIFEIECHQAIQELKTFYLKRNLKSYQHLSQASVYRIEDLLNRMGKTMEDFSIEMKEKVKDTKEIQDMGIKMITHLVNELGLKGPAVIIGFLPPICPAVYPEEGDVVFDWVSELQDKSRERYSQELIHWPIYEGISDFSQFGLRMTDEDISSFTNNLVGWKGIYHYPFTITKEFNIPLINLGPIGKDAHKKTERLYLPYALDVLPNLLKDLILVINQEDYNNS